MITGTHAIIYAEDAEAAREFLRDVLELPSVDAGDGWLIFKLPPAELGIHPADGRTDPPGAGEPSHELFFMCDDVVTTVKELEARGVEFTRPIEQRGYGLITSLRVPGAGEIGLYQPRHATAHELGSAVS